jgi:hypothetical protein
MPTRIAGLKVFPNGAVAVTYTEPIARHIAGLPVSEDGSLCCTTPVPPVTLRAFSNAFSSAEFN